MADEHAFESRSLQRLDDVVVLHVIAPQAANGLVWRILEALHGLDGDEQRIALLHDPVDPGVEPRREGHRLRARAREPEVAVYRANHLDAGQSLDVRAHAFELVWSHQQPEAAFATQLLDRLDEPWFVDARPSGHD